MAFTVWYLVVAGGGGGGGTTGPGGGAGGYRSNAAYDYSVTTGSYTVTVGAGGAGGGASNPGAGAKGGDSVFATITSEGGGLGAGYPAGIGGNGGSGGGGRNNGNTAGTGTIINMTSNNMATGKALPFSTAIGTATS